MSSTIPQILQAPKLLLGFWANLNPYYSLSIHLHTHFMANGKWLKLSLVIHYNGCNFWAGMGHITAKLIQGLISL